jgi:hypothetical protein
MILDNHYAVVFKSTSPGRPEREFKIMNENSWIHLNELSKEGHFVILEAWNITQGKCVSN